MLLIANAKLIFWHFEFTDVVFLWMTEKYRNLVFLYMLEICYFSTPANNHACVSLLLNISLHVCRFCPSHPLFFSWLFFPPLQFSDTVFREA